MFLFWFSATTAARLANWGCPHVVLDVSGVPGKDVDQGPLTVLGALEILQRFNAVPWVALHVVEREIEVDLESSRRRATLPPCSMTGGKFGFFADNP